jgi:hypothetical protein
LPRNPLWGIRDLEDVEKEARANGLKFVEKMDMPANNFTVIFKKQA